MKKCTDYKNWVEEKIIEPIKKKKKGAKEKCKKKKCKKWCLCCNRWICWIVVFFYWVTEWVSRIVGKWLIYTVCRIISAILTLGWTLLVGLFWFWCKVSKSSREVNDPMLPLKLREMKTLHIEVVIIDYDNITKNPITEREIEDRIAKASRILRKSAKIEVKREGKIRRDISKSLYRINSSNFGIAFGEWLKASFLLTGRDSVRRLTLYAVRNIKGAVGLHQPLYGSVFIEPNTPDILLAHEIGHSLLSIANSAHVDETKNLMHAYQEVTERDVGWPANVPLLTSSQWCSMRRSRWLDWSWSCERCP